MARNKPLFFLFLTLLSLIILPIACKKKKSEIEIIPEALKNHLQRARLFGNIQHIETSTYYYSETDSNFFLSNKTIQKYSADGFLTEALVFDKNNDTISKKTVYYLPTAQENFWEEFNYKEFTFTKDTFIYDRYGFIAERRVFLDDSLLYKIQFKTDGIGSSIEIKRLLPDYHITNLMYYNEHGLVERIEEYDPNNKLYKFFTIEYDNYGDEVNRRAFKNNNQMIEYTYTQYSDNGLLQKIIFEDRIHNMREDRIYTQHDTKRNWLEEIVLLGNDTVRKRIRSIEYY